VKGRFARPFVFFTVADLVRSRCGLDNRGIDGGKLVHGGAIGCSDPFTVRVTRDGNPTVPRPDRGRRLGFRPDSIEVYRRYGASRESGRLCNPAFMQAGPKMRLRTFDML